MGEHRAKRKRVRKGTHSCWECRRRKVKCLLASPDDDICINCRRKGTQCVSQLDVADREEMRGSQQAQWLEADTRKTLASEHESRVYDSMANGYRGVVDPMGFQGAIASGLKVEQAIAFDDKY